MRILVVGAGGIGGYFGGRLLQAGRDVVFLVRERRAAQLARTGLVIRSPKGDVDLPAPPIVHAAALRYPVDLILLSCKAYDLDGAIESFAPAVGPGTAILPLLNGMRHLDSLAARFGGGAVLGGQCLISVALDAEGRVLHLTDLHTLTFGERDRARSARIAEIDTTLSGAGFDTRLSPAILQEMWEKWIFIATTAGITCLMRGTIGDIVAADAGDLALALFDECAAIATSQGYPPSAAARQRSRQMMSVAGSPVAASMFRDIEQGGAIEGDHILGDLLRRGTEAGGTSPLLRIALAHLKTYEARRAREGVKRRG